MRALIACEFSGIVRDEFSRLDWDAWSCDLLPTESELTRKENKHIQSDVMNIINDDWNLVIAHPPCTYLANAGLHYLRTRPGRIENLKEAYKFILEIWNCSAKYIAIENPVGWLNTNWMKPTQIIQPYYFGDPEIKTTCLWLKNLPALYHSDEDNLFCKKTSISRPIPKGSVIRKSGQKAGERYNYYWREGKNAKERSKTFPGIARAMAQQWTEYILKERNHVN